MRVLVLDPDSRCEKWVLFAVGAAFYLLAQGPLIWLLMQGHDKDTFIGIVRHAPNQFLFLFIFFPAALLVVGQLILRLHGSVNRTPRFRISPIKIVGAYLAAAVLAFSLAALDKLQTPEDFYGKQSDQVVRAVALYENLAAAGEFSAADRNELISIYGSPEAGRILDWLEAIELFVVAFLAVLVGLSSLVSLKLRLSISDDDPETNETRKHAVLLILAVLSFGAWCPLRAHNIQEIVAVLGDSYETTQPVFVMLAMLVIVVYAMVIFYRNLWKAAKAMKRLVAGLVAIGGLGAMTWFTVEPTYLREFLQLLSLPSILILAIVVFLIGFLLASLFAVDELEKAANELVDD